MSETPLGMWRPEAKLLSSMMQPLPSEHSFGVFVNNKEIDPGSGVIITSPWGSWALGTRPEGYPGVLYREPLGGGALTLPWSRMPDGKILVGLILGNRPNMGGQVLELMGGMVDGNESKADVQAREAGEESGLDTKGAVPLPGGAVLQDRLVYVADIKADEGVHLFAIEIPFDGLELNREPTLDWSRWKPEPGLVKHKREAEVVFLPIRMAATSPDVLVHSAIVRLMIMLDMI